MVIETFSCISAFVHSSLDPHHCVLIAFLVFLSCSPLQMPLEGDIWSTSLFVQAGILPFLYFSLFISTSNEMILKIKKIQPHPFDFQKRQYLSIKEYIYLPIGWFSEDQLSQPSHKFTYGCVNLIPHSMFVSMNGLPIYLGNRHLFRETSPVITLNSIMKETKSSLPRQLYQ